MKKGGFIAFFGLVTGINISTVEGLLSTSYGNEKRTAVNVT